jgi:cell division protease FtsH
MASPKSTPRLSPRGGDRRGTRPATPRPSSSLWYGLAFLLVLGFAQLWFMVPPGRSIPYSEFKSLLKDDQVVEVTIGEQSIRGTLKQAVPEDPKGSKQFTTTRVDDSKLTEDLEGKGVKYTGEVANRWLGDLLSWVIPAIFFIGIWGFFFRRMGGAEGGVMSFARSRAKIYADDEVKVRFTDVAGVDEAEDELKEIVEFLKNPKKYTNLGGRIPKGVLLVGPPGTGKTLLARAVAGEAHVPFFSLSGSEFVEMFVGVGAARIRDLFQQAEAKAPCIVFIDELDALGKVRVQSPLGSHEEREQTLNQLLAEMDGFDSRKGVIIMGATNRPEVLDPALLRPGRFDRQVLVDKPDVKGREEILRIHSRSVKMAPDVDIKVVAARTAGFAGADLANLVNEAALLAARSDKTSVGMKDFESAIDRLVAGLEKKRVMSTKEREIVAYHESGHAIVASVLPNLDPVHKISIVQRGFGALGYTMQLPLEDRYLMTRADLLSQLAVLLGGRTAEEIALSEISTGAQNDLQRATDIARAMVTEFGMSEALGAINYDGNKRARFLDIPMPQERGLHGEDTARLIDSEIKRILTEAHDRARDILTSHRDKLETVTRRLLEIEVMEGDELRRLLGLPPSAHDTFGQVPLPPLDSPAATPPPTE